MSIESSWYASGGGPERRHHVLTVLGRGKSLEADVRRFAVLGDVMAVGPGIAFWPYRLDHAVCCHDIKLTELYLDLRRARGFDTGAQVHCLAKNPASAATILWELGITPCDSEHFAALLGVAMGYEQVRLMGAGLSGCGSYYDFTGAPDPDVEDKREQWLKTRRAMPNVRSASGFTAAILGRLN